MEEVFRVTIQQDGHKVSVEVDRSDLTIDEVAELIKDALAGAGFGQKSIEEVFNEKE